MKRNPFATLAGSSLGRATPPTEKPRKRSGVLTHVCFDQRAGQSKPPHCSCGTHVSKKHAKHLVDSGQADYLLSSRIRNGLVQPYPTKQVIVLAQAAPETAVIELDRRHMAEARKTEILLKCAAKRRKQIAERREELLKSFRYFLRTEVTGGYPAGSVPPIDTRNATRRESGEPDLLAGINWWIAVRCGGRKYGI
jgi:hypothetical protein